MGRIAVLTSGGDAQGMNGAIRSVVRSALDRGIEVYAISEGYQGMVSGGRAIKKMTWGSVGGILHRGGTVIGTARCKAFRTREGRLTAARNLLEHEINNLVVIGGDGSLTGANIFREEWSGLIAELVEKGEISQELADQYPNLNIVGLTGSIDNDMYGTDMTIGADTALHRITEAIDAISSTAASHQRTFVVEVMGRNCGYLALMGALASSADWVLIPESPPDVPDWEKKMIEVLKAGRAEGRRDSIVVIAEGAKDRDGNPITSRHLTKVLEEQLGEEVRLTILGHVQRGGAPSAFDRNLGTLLGYQAVQTLLDASDDSEPQLIGMRGNRLVSTPLMQCVQTTHSIAEKIAAQDYEKAMELRGGSFKQAFRTLRTLIRAKPHELKLETNQLRLAVMHSGAPAPGMNAAVRAAVRLGLDKGHIMFGIRNGYHGLMDDDIQELDWMSVNGWASVGGAELGTNRYVPESGDFYLIARTIEKHKFDGILLIGGEAGYDGAYAIHSKREDFHSFQIPIVCLPATIDNDRPGSELSIGADTALNSIVEAVDKIKQSAVASQRAFVVEVMGGNCGYLALMSGLATGAERVYLHEEDVRLKDLTVDLEKLVTGFQHGKRLGLLIRNERAHEVFTTDFMVRLFEAEGGDLFQVRQAILGHLQQGGNPTPFDRIQATRLASRSIDYLEEQSGRLEPGSAFIGLEAGKVKFTDLDMYPKMIDKQGGRPKEQWWLDLRPIARVLAKPDPSSVD